MTIRVRLTAPLTRAISRRLDTFCRQPVTVSLAPIRIPSWGCQCDACMRRRLG